MLSRGVCDQAHKMHDIFAIILELHLKKLFTVGNQIIPHSICIINFLYLTLSHLASKS